MNIDLNIGVAALSKIKGDLSQILTDGENNNYLEETWYNLQFELTYPFKVKVPITIAKADCIADILVPIAKRYKEIYQEEKATSKLSADRSNGNLINRAETDGKYQIWGHVIEDLVFEGLKLNKDGLSEVYIGS